MEAYERDLDPRMDNVNRDPGGEKSRAARDWLRAWMRTADENAFGRLGQNAIRASADTAARLSGPDQGGSAKQILQEIERLANTLDVAPVASPHWWPRGRPMSTPIPIGEAFGTLVARLDRERDGITRQLILLQSDRARFADTDRTLEDAAGLIRALGPVLDAAAREVRGQDPARGALLDQHRVETLPERERAVLTQLAINRQALLTLDLLIANQATLERALEQARTATLSALQVAMAAKRATGEAAALAQQGAALAQTARASEDRSGGTDHARRMLGDAVAQALAAIAASEPPLPR